MAVSAQEIAFAADLFSDVGTITHRKMMGGATFYANGQVFAILSAQGQIYLKASGAFAETLAQEGCEKFDMGDGRTMGYWTLPGEALDDPEAATLWARRALDAL